MQNRIEQNLFCCLLVYTNSIFSEKNSCSICSNRQSRRDQWSSSQATARGERQLPRPHSQHPQTKRPPHRNQIFDDSTEKNDYDTKNPTATHIEITRPTATRHVEGQTQSFIVKIEESKKRTFNSK